MLRTVITTRGPDPGEAISGRLLRHPVKRGIPRNDNFLLSFTIILHDRYDTHACVTMKMGYRFYFLRYAPCSMRYAIF